MLENSSSKYGTFFEGTWCDFSKNVRLNAVVNKIAFGLLLFSLQNYSFGVHKLRSNLGQIGPWNLQASGYAYVPAVSSLRGVLEQSPKHVSGF